jgi:hypothetical protein
MRSSVRDALIVGASLLAPGVVPPAQAQYPPACYSICGYQTPCDVDCMADPAEPYSATTCGGWGQCDIGCTPNWQRVPGSERQIGRARRRFPQYWQDNCKDVVQYTVRDVNGCFMDRTECEEKWYTVKYSAGECWEWGARSCP